ncbi:MAG: tripartite tricarboxylate transporter substrate-binding protein [Pseudomonadota bacterium]
MRTHRDPAGGPRSWLTPSSDLDSRNGRFKDFADLLAYAKANPGKVSIAHSGNGTTNHVAILQMQGATGLLAPAKTPARVVEQLNKALNDALADPYVQKRLRDLGIGAHAEQAPPPVSGRALRFLQVVVRLLGPFKTSAVEAQEGFSRERCL